MHDYYMHALVDDDDIADITKVLSGLESNYYKLGMKLHLHSNRLDVIEKDNPRNCESAFGQVIVQWIRMNYNYPKFGPPSWRLLVEAVCTIDHELAKEIASNHQKKLR